MADAQPLPVCIVRGSINHDEYFHVDHIVRPGETLASHGHESRVGGKGANQAVAVARAGGNVQFYGAVGRDGAWIQEKMGEYGVGGEIIVVDEPTGRAIIQVDKEGENSIVLFPGANHSEAVERAYEARGAEWFPPSACVLLQNEISPRATRYAMDHAGEAVVVYNPSPLPPAAELGALPWAQVAWLVVNAAEARGVLSALVNTANAQGDLQSADPGEVLARLAELPALWATSVVCTLGAGGVIAAVRGAGGATETVRVGAAALRGAVRDTTGAGDCFTGYFAQGIVGLRGPGADAIARVLKTCVVAAGMCCEKRGTVDSIPVRAHVEERMRLA